MHTEIHRPKAEQKQAVVLALVLMLVSFVFLAALTMSPKNNGRDLAVFFPPSMSLAEIVTALAPLPVDMVRTGLFESLVILRPRNNTSLSQLQGAGAWLVLDAYANGGCSFLKKKILS